MGLGNVILHHVSYLVGEAATVLHQRSNMHFQGELELAPHQYAIWYVPWQRRESICRHDRQREIAQEVVELIQIARRVASDIGTGYVTLLPGKMRTQLQLVIERLASVAKYKEVPSLNDLSIDNK